ncbi:hypothetical protein PSH79_12055 [Pseudomonas sp. FP2196]|uniref:hypothetical protein n=1 Tax=Pseudomonas sp. FP2196 TaxID=2954086 RepID=UPI002733D05F|nr:hypothetical protein [Pseudomonas sp. FP2196]WLH37994.1 hypothetical protein PSH79_12055 [Pseudomonas sp. FP2196]
MDNQTARSKLSQIGVDGAVRFWRRLNNGDLECHSGTIIRIGDTSVTTPEGEFSFSSINSICSPDNSGQNHETYEEEDNVAAELNQWDVELSLENPSKSNGH